MVRLVTGVRKLQVPSPRIRHVPFIWAGFPIPTPSGFLRWQWESAISVICTLPWLIPSKSHSSPLTSNGTPLAAPPNSTLFSSLGHTHDSSDATTHPPSRSRNWRSMVININSIVNTRAEFEAVVDYYKPDAIFMSETKFNNQIASAEFIPPGYHAPCRKDRNRHRGGALLAIRDCYSAAAVDMPDSPAEIVWSQVSLTNQRKIFPGACYRSPSGDANTQLEVLENSLQDLRKITRNAPSNTIILGGDFSLKDINWEDESVDSGTGLKQASEKFISLLHDNNLSQLQREATKEGSVLDLFITNRPALVKHISTVPGESDHDGTIIRAHTPKIEVLSSQILMLPTERACSN